MRIAYVLRNPFPPELYAGTEMTVHWLCRALAGNGHEVVVVCTSGAIADGQVRVDRSNGYTIVRTADLAAATTFMAAQPRPDVFVVNQLGQWAEHVLPMIAEVPVVTYVHEVSNDMDSAPAALMARASFIANSPVTSAHLLAEYGLASTIVPPLFGVDRYAGVQSSGNHVLFVSLQHRKGADVAIRIAQSRPNTPFVFVESWTLDVDATLLLRGQISEIANITHLTNQPGLGEILPHIKLLLMPSRSQEAWGRTATEAQFCGVPVLGSSRGNLPKTIGPGGVTLDPDEPIERWLDAFDRIMDDPAVYEDLSRKALEHTRPVKDEIRRGYQAFEIVLADAVARPRS
jgi:glycosyltransferase involved in cell wall biosynthesis